MKKVLLLGMFFVQSVVSVAQESALLTEDERLYGLSQIWSEARYNFVYYDQLTIDWDSLYKATIPKVKKATEIKEYYDELRRFAVQLHDGHTGVWYPMSFYRSLSVTPAIKTDIIQGKVFITQVLNDTLSNQGISKGMEILKIDGINVREYAEKYIAPYESASTSQGKDLLVYAHNLLSGPIDKPVRLTLKDVKGKIAEKEVSRKLQKISMPVIQFSQVRGQIGLLKITSFDSKDFQSRFDEIYPDILKTKALIIDLRENGGGNSQQGLYILKHLTNRPFLDASTYTTQYMPLLKVWGFKTTTFFQLAAGANRPFTDKTIYDKPVVVLISKNTYSAAEDFCVAFDYMKRGSMVGEPTGGSTGQPMFVKLPGGGTFRVCVKKDTYPDGKVFVGVGIRPDITVNQTVPSFLKNEDTILAKALEGIK